MRDDYSTIGCLVLLGALIIAAFVMSLAALVHATGGGQ